ncbi:uncharacterized protein N7473_010514 [Penicillium subrubescens]|uniref:uncharacterized protein n=1 Tax=Penicillium subrubescens TaxID=1316194 RepID=UPI00254514CF|nr:uncharacterized protein N7473_010514 [Penicillium subrubescens]KAJ5883628.1 hypothetical protein N7473_010514 [Penicillium subrubescens]
MQPLSPTEKHRICRTLYRLEIWCNISPNKSSGSQARPISLISHPWSVNSSPASTRAEILRLGTRKARRLALDNSAYQVCLGLGHVKKIIDAPLPTVRQWPGMKIEEARGWFFNKFMRRHIQSWDVKKARHRIGGEQGDLEFLPSYPDPDTGPDNVWRWANTGEKLINAVNNPNRRVLRKWGYVMWARRRLNAKGLMDEPWAG